MFNKALCILSNSFNPYYNLAMEEVLLKYGEKGVALLYLWQNHNTVVIGKNQNCYLECNLKNMEIDDVFLARRLSGGGAVFHDKGNLNFTFITSKQDYSPCLAQNVILEAVRSFGIEANISGRNDILVEGRKFSGNAVYHGQQSSYYHGTLLINADLPRFGKYLNASKAKLESKGVKSVAARVANLCEFYPDISIDKMKTALISEFSSYVGHFTSKLVLSKQDESDILELKNKYSSSEWLYKNAFDANYSVSNKFSWGEITIGLNLKNGLISDCFVNTDALETEIFESLPLILIGKKPSKESLTYALANLLENNIITDIISLFN